MATNVESGRAVDVGTRVRREGRGRSEALSSFLLVGPTTIALALFFIAPLWYIFEFSTGLKWVAPNDAAALINGELTAFSTELWADFLGKGVIVEVLPNIGESGAVSFTVPAILIGAAFVALVFGAVAGGRFGERAGLITGLSFVALLIPFLTLPLGNHILRLAQFSSESTDLRLFFKSVSMATTSSVIAVLVAFPVAYYLAFCVQKTKYTWLLIVITPFLTSYLLRIFAWKVVLGDQGLINSGLMSLGIIDSPMTFLIYNQFTVMVVLTYAWVPFICLPIFIALENMDRRLLEAATDLGASRLKAFAKITLPLAAPGIVAAFLFVFIPSIGEYITPSLVGGTKGYMFGQAIADHFIGGAFDWQGGSVLALFLLVVVLFLTATTSKFLRAGGGTA